jgi:Skp family chaperone for outer membrane proteins
MRRDTNALAPAAAAQTPVEPRHGAYNVQRFLRPWRWGDATDKWSLGETQGHVADIFGMVDTLEGKVTGLDGKVTALDDKVTALADQMKVVLEKLEAAEKEKQKKKETKEKERKAKEKKEKDEKENDLIGPLDILPAFSTSAAHASQQPFPPPAAQANPPGLSHG